jgi:purine nucleoside permease
MIFMWTSKWGVSLKMYNFRVGEVFLGKIDFMSLRNFVLMLTVGAAAMASAQSATQPVQMQPIQVKVVVVAMFELGADTGDAPGELQYWVERDHLDKVYEIAGAGHAARMNDQGEMAVLTLMGPSHAAATITAVALDPRFDFSHAYWIVAGIAGSDPERAPLGSAVWAKWVVDGDLGYEIDAREMPKDWQTGELPLRKARPFEEPVQAIEGQVFELNGRLAEWAYGLTKDLKLTDTPEMAAARNLYGSQAAERAPLVLMGDELSSARYWHGEMMEAWAREWVKYFTGGKGVYTTCAMEDTGTLQALKWLSASGRVDWQRVMVLRTVSNFDRQWPGVDASESLNRQRTSRAAAYLPSLESAYGVGHAVVAEILKKWPAMVDSAR